METTRTSWAVRAEDAIRALRDVEGASIQLEADEIREIHVLTRSTRPPKQIVRDVQTVLLTRFNRHIDYRVVSVAYAKTDAPKSAASVTPIEPPEPAEAPTGERIRFSGVNLFVSGPRTQAQVELKWKGLPRMGSASGWSTRAGAHRLVATATVAAVQEFLADQIALGVQHVEVVRLGKRRVAMVSLTLLAERQEKVLVGNCLVEGDVLQAVVLATLAALNRVVGGFRAKEPTEYILRPTST